MSLTLNMVGGGGQGEGPIEGGTIAVKYPAGATCTVTNGSQTYTALDTYGAAAFIVEPGMWTVKATPADGGDPVSESVTVAASGWIEVKLSFGFWLYDYETKKYGVNFTAVGKLFNSGSTYTQEPEVSQLPDGSLQIKITNYNACGMWYSEPVELSEYGALYVFDSTSETADDARNDIVIWSSIGTYIWENVSASIEQRNRTEELRSIDVSALSGSYYVGYAMFNTGTINLKEMYLI